MDRLFKIIKEDLKKSYLLINNNNSDSKYLIAKINSCFDTLIDVNYMTLKEMISRLYFIIDDNIIIKVMERFNLNYSTSKLYLDNILPTLYLEKLKCSDATYLFNKKIILEIKEFLKENDLFKNDPFFELYLKNKTIVIYGDQLDGYEKYFLKNINYDFIDINDKISNNKQEIFEFKSSDEEIAYVLEDISKLLEKDSNNYQNIYIVSSSSSDYNYQLSRISKMYNLVLNKDSDVCLFDNMTAKNIINKIKENQEIDVDSLQDNELIIYKQIINFINKYPLLQDNSRYQEFLEYKLKNTKVKSKKYQNGINVISIDDAFSIANLEKNNYFYFLGLYQGNIISINKDEDYYSDLIKSEYSINTSSKVNTNNLNRLLEILSTNNYFVLSYSNKSNFNKYIPSSIVNKENIVNVKKSFSYSHYSDKLNIEIYKKKYDSYSKYNNLDLEFLELNKTYNEFNDYNTYDNRFKGINADKIIDKINKNKKGLSLSYTSMDLYNKCSFAYYIKYILKLGTFQGNFMTFVGSLYHKVIEEFFSKKDFNFNDSFNEAFINEQKNYTLQISEEYLMKNLKEDLKNVLDFLKYQLDFIQYKNTLSEEEVNVNDVIRVNGREINTNFTGKIDKLMYKEVTYPDGSDHTLIAIIDYKTSEHIKFEVNLTQYGLSLQLPIYAYLASNFKKLKNVVVGGFFIQPILSNDIPSSDNIEEFNEAKRKNYLLNGFINSDTKNDEYCFDSSYNSSLIIKSLKTNNDGSFSKNSKVMSNEEIISQIQNVQNIINKDFKDIASAKFDINPKKQGTKNISCDYCEYRDLCYHTPLNYVYLSDSEEEGEDNE